MDAKTVGEEVKEFAENMIRENLKAAASRSFDDTYLVDWLGTALILQGCMLMLEAGCPADIVLSRSVSCVRSFQEKAAKEAVDR